MHACMQSHMHAHIHILQVHAYTDTYTHAKSHAYALYKHINANHIHTHTHTHTHASTHARKHTRNHACTKTDTIWTRTYMLKHVCTCRSSLLVILTSCKTNNDLNKNSHKVVRCPISSMNPHRNTGMRALVNIYIELTDWNIVVDDEHNDEMILWICITLYVQECTFQNFSKVFDNFQDFFLKTEVKTFASKPRPRHLPQDQTICIKTKTSASRPRHLHQDLGAKSKTKTFKIDSSGVSRPRPGHEDYITGAITFV